jgi:polyhydroxyalkanoate synthesis regulator phasin
MSCTGKIKNNCRKVNSSCVSYENEVPEFSDLYEEGCLSIEETTEDLYNLIGDIKEELDFESLRNGCITYPSDELKILDVLTAMQDFICSQQETINSQQTTIETLQQQVIDLQQQNCP